jgi:SAM-dependent methyltransferase
MPASAAVDPERLDAFLGQFVLDAGAAMATPNIIAGDRLGLYRALADTMPATPAQVAEKAGCDERYVREWLCGQAAGGYVEYDRADGSFSMTPEQVACLADESSPTFVAGAFEIAGSVCRDIDRLTAALQDGDGVGWHEHDPALFRGTDRFFRPGYVAHLLTEWLPALDGVVAKLEAGAKVADVGCGLGASTILMAEAFPASAITGFDYHDASIEAARATAARAGVAASFEVAPAAAFGGTGYDLVCMFDCLHDMGDPVGAARHVRDALAPDGTWLLVEPMAGDRVEDNLNPVGRIFYSASTLICTPASRSQEVGLALGAQAGPERLAGVVGEGGFSRFRRAAETPFNLVFEARP